jgi:hypothetical protein
VLHLLLDVLWSFSLDPMLGGITVLLVRGDERM